MLTFTLAISCLTTSNLPWFMDLTFQVPLQYCSLQHWTLLLSPVPSTTGCCFWFGSIPSFFLELFLHSSPVVYWEPTNLGSSSFSVLYFCLFILFMGFSRQEYWSGLPFPSPVDHILSSRKSRNTWSNRQICPWSTEWSRTKANRVLPRERTGHSKYPLLTTQEKTLHMCKHQTQTDYILCSQRWRSSIQSAKTRRGADCGSDHELLITKFRLKLKKVGKTTRPFRYDLNQSLMIIQWKWEIDLRDEIW